MITIGEKVWNRLRAEGGFVHTTADGRKFVRFNRGCKCSPELRDLLKRHSEDLKEFIDVRHAEGDRAWHRLSTPRGQGSSRSVAGGGLKGRGAHGRDCNAEMRSNISAETPSKWDFSHRRGSAAVSPAISAVLAAVFAVFSEIQGAPAHAPGGSVGFGNALLTKSFSGGGAWVCLAESGVNTKTGR